MNYKLPYNSTSTNVFLLHKYTIIIFISDEITIGYLIYSLLVFHHYEVITVSESKTNLFPVTLFPMPLLDLIKITAHFLYLAAKGLCAR